MAKNKSRIYNIMRFCEIKKGFDELSNIYAIIEYNEGLRSGKRLKNYDINSLRLEELADEIAKRDVNDNCFKANFISDSCIEVNMIIYGEYEFKGPVSIDDLKKLVLLYNDLYNKYEKSLGRKTSHPDIISESISEYIINYKNLENK